MMQSLFREPLIHFLVLAALIFVLFGARAPEAVPAGDVIEVSGAQVARLAAQHEAVWRRAPTPAELRDLVDEHVRDEVYYREAVALGLDRDDTMVRR